MARKGKRKSIYQQSVNTLAVLLMTAMPEHDKYTTLEQKFKRMLWSKNPARVRSPEELRLMEAAKQKRAKRLVRNQLWLINYRRGKDFAAYCLGLR